MQEKIYILMTSSGSYDDYMTHIVGIYTSAEMAEIGKGEYSDAITKFFDENPCPVDAETMEKIENYEINIEDEDNSNIELYNDWVYKTYGVSEMCKNAWVVEKILNKTNLELIENRAKYL